MIENIALLIARVDLVIPNNILAAATLTEL